jgi:hypothetical protein
MFKKPIFPVPGNDAPRTCLISFAHAEDNLSRCVGYEFEDVVRQIESPDLWYFEPTALYPIRKRVVNRSTKCFSPAHRLNPGIHKFKLAKTYDLGVVICQLANDLFALNAVEDLHQRCGVTVCWLEEAWVKQLNKHKGHMKLLSRFDYLFTSCSQSALKIQEATGRPCAYLAPGVDTLRFCPYPNPPERSIDVYSLGRRSEVTHKALLELAQASNLFYIYDTLETKDTKTPLEHRDLIANLCKRASFFIANTAKIDLPTETHCQAEVGYRFFEGAASGTIMIGERPNNPMFERLFPWQDAVIHLPFHHTEIKDFLQTVKAQTQHLETLRKKGITHCLRTHDWAYRWDTILKTVGLDPRDSHGLRIHGLHGLADAVEGSTATGHTLDTSELSHLPLN